MLNLLNIKNIFYQSNERNRSFKSFLLQLNRKGLLEDFRKNEKKMRTLKNLSACTMTLSYFIHRCKRLVFLLLSDTFCQVLHYLEHDVTVKHVKMLAWYYVIYDLTHKYKSKGVFKWQTCKLLRQSISCRCQTFYSAAIMESNMFSMHFCVNKSLNCYWLILGGLL
jgi:hypothetical protein